MKHKKKLLSAVASMACMSVLLLSGCGTDPSDGAALSESGTLILSVNPEIEITYNSEGKVTALTGGRRGHRRILSGLCRQGV